jgi:hypothetical protein
MEQEVADSLAYCRVERRLADLTCSAYERDVRACLAFLSERGIRDLGRVGAPYLRAFIAAEAPVPVKVVSNPTAPLGPSDLAVLVVETVAPSLRAAATRVLTEDVPYVVLVRRDVWSAGSEGIHRLLDEVQRDPRHKLVRFWRDRDELEQVLREAVFSLDGAELVGQAVADGSFVKVGSRVEQAWELENTGFCVWEERLLREHATEHLAPDRATVEIPRTGPGERVRVAVGFTAPTEPASCRSVWQMVGPSGLVCFPWSTGMWCQVLAVA